MMLMESNDNTNPNDWDRMNGEKLPEKFDLMVSAVESTLNATTSNESRLRAAEFIESVKNLPEAAYYGYELVRAKNLSVSIRYFGLTLLEEAVKFKWSAQSSECQVNICRGIVTLALELDSCDPSYFSGKISHIWTEIAKRVWPTQWHSMDRDLWRIWLEKDALGQRFVLSVLEGLSEDIFQKDDIIVGMRTNELGHACIEIMTPINCTLKDRESSKRGKCSGLFDQINIRCDNDGWITRICDMMIKCINRSENFGNPGIADAMLMQATKTLRSMMGWIPGRAIEISRCLDCLMETLTKGNLEIKIAALESLSCLFSRNKLDNTNHEDMAKFMSVMLDRKQIEMLSSIYEEYGGRKMQLDVDEREYLLLKRLIELLGILVNGLDANYRSLCQLTVNGRDILWLLNSVMKHDSLTLTKPAIQSWSRILKSRNFDSVSDINEFIGEILEICCQRLVKFELLRESHGSATFIHLYRDIDTVPERHVFLGNYRKYCHDIIENIVRRAPIDASRFILGRAKDLLSMISRSEAAESSASVMDNFVKNSIESLRVDAQLSSVEAIIKGYHKKFSTNSTNSRETSEECEGIRYLSEEWIVEIHGLEFRNPEIEKKFICTLANLAIRVLPDKGALAIRILERFLTVQINDVPERLHWSEAVQLLENSYINELSKFGLTFSDALISIYDTLEQKIRDVCANGKVSEKRIQGFTTFLFLIIHRTKMLNFEEKLSRLAFPMHMVENGWKNLNVEGSGVSDIFNLLELENLPGYLESRRFRECENWSAVELDGPGQELQSLIGRKLEQLPLRITKSLILASTDMLHDETSEIFKISLTLWNQMIPIIIPKLLRLIDQSQAFTNYENWPVLSDPMKIVIKRILTDRFWQVGISRESRDDFFVRVSSSKQTYEGLASTVRGSNRQIRELCYWILYGFSRLKACFYGIPHLSLHLSESLFSNMMLMSSHHVSVSLNVSIQIIEQCPPEHREAFLPNMISRLFRQLDDKIIREWDLINRRIDQSDVDLDSDTNGNIDDLNDEMKFESVLRQLTYAAITFAKRLLQATCPRPTSSLDEVNFSSNSSLVVTPATTITASSLIYTNNSLLEPILIFVVHCLRVRDTRSCSQAISSLRSVIEKCQTQSNTSSNLNQFLCDTVLKAAITSLHESYFVDIQKELASLIALIIMIDDKTIPHLQISRNTICQLPGMSTPEKVRWIEYTISKIRAAGATGSSSGERRARSYVFQLLDDIRGVSIYESGKINPKLSQSASISTTNPRKSRKRISELYVQSLARMKYRGESVSELALSSMTRNSDSMTMNLETSSNDPSLAKLNYSTTSATTTAAAATDDDDTFMASLDAVSTMFGSV